MISVEQAHELIKLHVKPLRSIEMEVANSLDYVLSASVISPIAMPPFPQSAMDGYAICISSDFCYEVVGAIAAGQSAENICLQRGQAVRIFTGAEIPIGADAVVAQEIADLSGNKVSFQNPPKLGSHIRKAGEQIEKGSMALAKGTVMNPAAIGFLCALGIAHIQVDAKPKIGIVVTGKELAAPGTPLLPGKIFDSNTAMLQAALQQSKCNDWQSIAVDDNFESTLNAIDSMLQHNDLVLISGGISVGDYDFVYQALQKIGVKEIFYKINQKPGKPLFFGKFQDKYVFALPGNPAAALSCFYVYVRQAIDIMSGKANTGLTTEWLPLSQAITNQTGKALFLKAKIEPQQLSILSHQNSSMLSSFAEANALAYLPANKTQVLKGEKIMAYQIFS